MSKKLARLLGEADYKLARVIFKLEELSGEQSHDIRLLTENHRLLRDKLADLGLDPDDTNALELRHALANKLQSDVHTVHSALNISHDSPRDEVARNVLKAANEFSLKQPILSVKTVAAKRLLKEQPPKRLMKLLKYRGTESMLKREDPRKLFALLPAAESSSWNLRFAYKIKKLSHSDYEMRDVEFLRAGLGNQATTKVTYSPLMGAVVVLPGLDLAERALEVIYQMLQAEEILQADSFYLKSYQFSHDFCERANRVFQSAEPPMVKIDGHEFIKWHHLKDLFDHHVSSLERLSKIHPVLNWWREAASLAQAEEPLVSLHLGDVFKFLRYGGSAEVSFNLKETLKTSLIRRYGQVPAVKDYIARQLDDKVIALDPANQTEILSPEIHSEFI
jgi:hypothetical protein